MKPRLSPSQGRIVRAIVSYLSKDGKNLMRSHHNDRMMTVEAILSHPWSSLTFTGERHRVVLNLPAGLSGDIDGAAIDLPGAIVAVEAAAWQATADGTCLTIDLLAIADRQPKQPSPA